MIRTARSRADPPFLVGDATTLPFGDDVVDATVFVATLECIFEIDTALAEQLFASGCEFLISITSSGQIRPREDPPYFVLIDRALRDEGTSHHYRRPEAYATLDSALRDPVQSQCETVSRPVYTGAAWTTDAPFRETEPAIERARSAGILAVEMEAAALYTFAAERDRPVVCFAHVTNQMGQVADDFEKGEANGSLDTLKVIDAAATAWRGTS